MTLRQLKNQVRNKEKRMKQYYIIYCRKSTDSEDKQLQSIDDQKNVLLALAKERNLPIKEILHEEKSAKDPGRPVFNSMIETIKRNGNIKGILCWKLNRLSRNPVDSGTLQWLIQSKIIHEIVTPAKIYLDADSDFLMSIEGAQANKFIRDLREDTIRGINSKIEKGWKPGLAPVGYRNTIEKPKGLREIEPHPVYFPLVKKIFEMALTGQYSLEMLGIEAQRLGIVSNMKMELSKKNIHKILNNPFYCGRFLYNNNLYVGNHETMISDKEFDLVQKFLTDRSKPRNKTYPMTGLIRCTCGFMITGYTRKKIYVSGKQAEFVYYRCTQRASNCFQPPIPARKLEAQVTDFLATIKLSPKLVTWAIRQLNVKSKEQLLTKEAQKKALKKNIDVVDHKLINLFDLRIHPDNIDGSLITDEEYKGLRQKLLVEKDSVERELIKVEGLVDDWIDVAVKTFNFASKAHTRWLNGTIADKRVILDAVGASLTLDNGNLILNPRSMFALIKESKSLGSTNKTLVRRAGFEPA